MSHLAGRKLQGQEGTDSIGLGGSVEDHGPQVSMEQTLLKSVSVRSKSHLVDLPSVGATEGGGGPMIG